MHDMAERGQIDKDLLHLVLDKGIHLAFMRNTPPAIKD